MGVRAGVNGLETTGFDELGYNGWKAIFERELRGLDAKVQPRVLDKDLNAPPGSPTNGAAYIVGPTPTGLWGGHAGHIARWDSYGPAWEFWTPKSGWMVFVADEAIQYRFNGTAWATEVKADLVDGKVPSSQLPSYVDDVIEVANSAARPIPGEAGKIYVTLDDNKTWRWSGSVYVEISASLALGESSSTAYPGDKGKTAYDHSQASGNPHGTTAAQVGAAPTLHTHAIDDIADKVTEYYRSSGDYGTSKFLRWAAFGSYHEIFDASAELAPNGSAVSQVDPITQWQPGTPTLMGWSGTSTFGVRVDTSRYAESIKTDSGAVLKTKKLTGTMAATAGTTVSVAHGLTMSKILSVNVLANVGGVLVPPRGQLIADQAYDFGVNSSSVDVRAGSTGSDAVLSAPFTILITYEA